MKDDSKNSTTCQTPVYFSVYVLWCSKTDKSYVGVTRQRVTRRISQHKRGKQFVDTEIQRIGWEHWDWWIVEELVPSNLISEREQYWVNFFGSVYPAGYNKTCGGISKLTVSDDTREKIRQNALARDIRGEKNPHYGKHHTDDVKETIRQARLRRTPWNKGMKGVTHHTAEHKAKIGAAVSGEKNGFFGKHHTEEAKEKNRQAHLGKPGIRGEKHYMYGKHHSEETKAKMREKALAREAAKRAAKEAQMTP